MNLRGLVVCVNYVDLLSRSLDLWHTGLDRLIVVTSPNDEATRLLCDRFNVETHITDIFYVNGAKFNKGAALSEAIVKTGLRNDADWLMTFDADIVPPENWRVHVERSNPIPGKLYGAYRYWQPENASPLQLDMTKRMPQSWVLGFFTMFHNTDRNVGNPVFDLHWPHAGSYDTEFTNRWSKTDQIILKNVPMIHQGEERMNWCGRGHPELLRVILEERRRRGGSWTHERIQPPRL